MEKANLSQPKIHCAYKDIVNPDTLKPHPMNPNQHPPQQIDYFISVLQYSGCRRPITVSTLSGFVTKGHGQLKAYLAANWDRVPVDFQEYESEEQELADIVADNEIQKMSTMDTSKLQDIGVKLDTGAFDMKLLGIDEKRLEKLMTLVKTAPELSGTDGTPLIGAGEPSDLPAGAEGPVSGDRPSMSHVRMVQLFFTEETQLEFMHIVEFFMKKIHVDNITDATLEVLRAAYRSHQETTGNETSTDLPNEPSPEGELGLDAGDET